ncbi:glycosyltransferase [Butyrivibrio sp. AC2005]|uniref:glycosyltransferase n=1 Tax=Butyrivibrio sp. AC2005 TaxID=1280672 RepID=UPI00040C2E5A|nr:glycosyltransferase [Butyrivibrio sp. AC2005]
MNCDTGRNKKFLDVVIYGAGKRAHSRIDLLNCLGVRIRGIVDSDVQKAGMEIGHYTVGLPSALYSIYDDCKICIEIVDEEAKETVRNNLTNLLEAYDEISDIELIIEAFSNSNICNGIVGDYSKNNYRSIIWASEAGLGLGGVEEYVKNVSIAMINAGIEHIRILTNCNKYIVPESITRIRLSAEYDVNKKNGFVDGIYPYFIKIIQNLPCVIITSGIDSIFCAAAIAKNLFPQDVKIISMIHLGTVNICKLQSNVSDYVDEYVAVSKWIDNQMRKNGHTNISVVTCPYICLPQIEREYTEDERLPIRIGYAGRLDGYAKSQKRMDLLILLFKELRRRKIFFIAEIAGDGPARIQMEKEISHNDEIDNIHFLGVLDRSDIPAFWAKQDIAVNVSDCEGHSISQMEAMANGAVPVMTRTSGTEDDIIDGKNGFLVEIGDYLAMADKIEYLFNNRLLLSVMGTLAHEAVYSKSLMSDHLNFWKNLLQV